MPILEFSFSAVSYYFFMVFDDDDECYDFLT